MSDYRAEHFRAALARGEISLQFGAERAVPGAELEVAVGRRITMPPEVLLRLLARLSEAVRQGEARAPAAPREVAAQMGKTLLNAPPQAAGEQAARLFALVDAIGAAYRYERSFRLAPGRLQANRVLLSVSRSQWPRDAAARFSEICRELGMPSAQRADLPALVAQARCVHFGYESDGQRSLYKVYFERAAVEDEARAAQPGTPVLLHLAYKWDATGAGACVTTRYEWRPRFDDAQMRSRMAELYGPGAPLDAALALLGLAAARADPAGLQFLEVSEDGNARRSFDLNVYDAHLAVRDAQAPLARLREYFGVRPGQYQALYDQIRNMPLGHFAGGVHRDGAPFATVYYGVQARG